jgi:hypothetical protein
MCKIVYLTSRRFDTESKLFIDKLKNELEYRNVEVVFDYSYDFLNLFKKHKTYGISIGFDFYKDIESGRGIILNKFSSNISRAFAYGLSSNIDKVLPSKWREFEFVKSDNKTWYKFFNKISAEAKIIFYFGSKNNTEEFEEFLTSSEKFVKVFADEIVRCLRSDYNYLDYQKRIDLYNRKNIIYQRNGGKNLV